MTLFNKHPNSVGETYSQHLLFTIKKSILLIVLSIVLLIHGIFPFIFKTYVGDRLKKLNENMVKRIK